MLFPFIGLGTLTSSTFYYEPANGEFLFKCYYSPVLPLPLMIIFCSLRFHVNVHLFFFILQVTWRLLLCRVNLPLYFSFTPTSHLWSCQPIQRKKHIVVTSPSTPFCKSSSPPLIHKGRITFKIASFFSISQNSSYICVK
jgi:hypothetical protein